ncbi:MAG: hypothetical protein IJ192_06810 [Clostridia bacterium]|nr:hypothetical protein [Clostridia bacterium]
MTQFNFGAMMSQENQIKQIPVDMLVPYHNHKFTLYQGERLLNSPGIITQLLKHILKVHKNIYYIS